MAHSQPVVGEDTEASRPHSLRFFVAMGAGALVLLAVFASNAAPGRMTLTPDQFFVALADTDTVSTAIPDTLIADSLALPDTGLVPKYVPSFRPDRPSVSPLPRPQRPFSTKLGRDWKHEVDIDSTGQNFTIHEKVGDEDVRYPITMNFAAYRLARLQYDLSKNWRELYLQRARLRQQKGRGGLGFNVVVPGGRKSAFTTIFGKNELNLRVNGQADIKAGFDYRKSDQQVALTGRATQINPNFKQDLRLGITGTIGDKLKIDVNYDSNNQFDYQNQIKLQYTGYEDEIIQKIEAGNVFLQTPSTLIRGGQSLFGIKSEFQIGGLYLTSVVSQQEGQANNLSIKGGSESTNFDIKPTDYEQDVHFFLGYYFRNRWEDALSDPPNIRVANGFERVAEIEVWKLQPTTPEEENVRQVVATVDLGESPELLRLADGYTQAVLPDPDMDQYDDTPGGELDAQLRDGNATPSSFLESSKGLTGSDFQVGRFKKLERGRDYSVDEVLGYITLRQSLLENEALAVAYRYIANGRSVQVGDFSTDTGGSNGGQDENKLVLKLLRPVQLRQPALESDFNPAVWYLQLRNIYRFPGSGINPNQFELQLFYEPPGKTSSKTLPDVGGQQTVLQLTGLDRLNEDQAPKPDDLFDYLVNYTIDPGNGRLFFPYLEPFGRRIEQIIDSGTGTATEKQQSKNLLAFTKLYTEKKENARRDTQHDVYRVKGSYQGSTQSFYDLRAYAGLVPGSVRVTSGGTPLSEGSDFTVDYQSGTVNITNPAFLSAGRDINIQYEQNSFFNLQKKTLLGLRADYTVNDNIGLGATFMKMGQKSPIDKYRIGEEPIQNTIWGVDGSLKMEPRWLTRAVDFLPLIQTKAKSAVSVTGEYAQLRPGTSETIAFQRTQRDLKKDGRAFNPDEQGGISYIDDFEGFENTFSLKQPGGWQTASAPDSVGAVDRLGVQTSFISDSLRTNWRGAFGWYTINANMLRELVGVPVFDQQAISIVQIQDVFPNRDTRAEFNQTLQTLDLYFDPNERGPYNYTTDLKGLLDNPKDAWGGMAQRLPEGFTDFSLKNIDFVEFVMRPFPENKSNEAGRSSKLYVDLGSISEDVLPNEKLNNEDGLSLSTIPSTSISPWGRTPIGAQNSAVDFDQTTRRTEDLGLDGLASYTDNNYEPFATEQGHFAPFISAIDVSGDTHYRAEVEKAKADPSGDDYHYFADGNFFDNPAFFPGGATFQQRFTRWFAGQELNAFETQNQLAVDASVRRGNSRFPDSEDRNLNSAIDTDNDYFQYEIPLSRAVLDSMAVPDRVNDFVVGEIKDQNGEGTGWYQVRIPVQKFTRRVGNIQDFTLIESMRLWTTGNAVPITIRLASLELVGSQWQKSTQIALERETTADTSDTRSTISSINNEENAGLYLSPKGAVISQSRLASGRVQNAREQAMSFRVENLKPGKQRAIFRTYNQGLDLLKYSNIRMFAHFHGLLGDGTDLAEMAQTDKAKARLKARLFVRLGANETNDYYEYDQPLTPSRETAGESDELWQTHQEFEGKTVDLNSMNLVLGALNQLKVARDRINFPTDSVFFSVVNDSLSLPDAPDAEKFAPPGTRLGIKGTPSLSRINTIVIGIRNPADSSSIATEDILQDVTVWVNELRVSGYDNQNGWAALVNADIQLADLARVKANFQTQTDGFGSLSSSLGDRNQVDLSNWSVTSEVQADKVLPARFGWSIPISIQVQSNTSTPRFSPTRGDVRLDEILAQIDERSDLDAAEKELEKSQAIESAQTHSFTRSITTRISKQGSGSGFLRTTLDGLSFNYSHSNTNARNPSLRLNDAWRWSSTLSYRLSVRRPKTVRPFWFMGKIPLVGLLGDLRFNYLPQSLAASGTASRQFSQTQDRPRLTNTSAVSNPLPDVVGFPVREKQGFSHNRSFQLQYNPFGFLNLSYDLTTNQSLNALGVDTLFTVVKQRSDNPDSVDVVFKGRNGARARQIQQDLVDKGETVYDPIERLTVNPATKVFGQFFKGAGGIRTEQHQQRFTATFRPQLTRSKALNWLNIQDVVYSSQFAWRNGPVGQNTGANVSNQFDIRGGVTLRIQDFWRKFGFYRNLEEAQRQAEAKKQEDRRQKERNEIEAKRLKAEKEAMGKKAADETEPNDKLKKDGKVQENEKILNDEKKLLDEKSAENKKAVPDQEAGIDENAGVDKKTDVDEKAAETKKSEEAKTKKSGGGLKLPLPSPASLFRKFVLAITGIRDLSITYTGSRSSNSSNVGRFTDDSTSVRSPWSIFDSFNGKGPSLGYRFGFQRRLDLQDRLVDPTLQVSDVFNNTNRVQGRTTLNPSQAFQINLNWNVDWSNGNTLTFRKMVSVDSIDVTRTQNGTNRSSVWTFGASYLNLFNAQLDTYRRDLAEVANPDVPVLGDENGDGRVVLTNQTVVDDFRTTFTSGFGPLDSRGLLPFPMPNWTINYTGLSQWPLFRNLVQSLTVRHGYNADYSSDFRTNTASVGSDSLSTFPLGPQLIQFSIPGVQAGTIRINERFQPLVGFDVGWKGNFQTNIAWSRSNTYSLSTSNFEVSQNKTNELSLTASFQKTGLKIPFLGGKRLNNRVSFSLTVSRSTTSDQRFSLKRALTAAAQDDVDFLAGRTTERLFKPGDALAEPNVTLVTAHTRLVVSPQVSYQFSNRVSANFTLRYEKFDSQDSRQPSAVNIQGNFNIRVNIQN